MTFGQPNYNPASRFLDEIPSGLLDWRRLGEAPGSWAAANADRRSRTQYAMSRGPGRGKPSVAVELAVGDRVLHTTFGMGTVLAVHGAGLKQQVDVDFGSAGKKRIAVSQAPMEKL